MEFKKYNFISGYSGSGKTSFVTKVVKSMKNRKVIYIDSDSGLLNNQLRSNLPNACVVTAYDMEICESILSDIGKMSNEPITIIIDSLTSLFSRERNQSKVGDFLKRLPKKHTYFFINTSYRKIGTNSYPYSETSDKYFRFFQREEITHYQTRIINNKVHVVYDGETFAIDNIESLLRDRKIEKILND